MANKLIILMIVLAGAYWYWSGPYQAGRQSGDAAQLQENSRNMKRCIRRETSVAAASAMAGAGVTAGDAQKLCAETYNLHLEDGQWHSGAD